MLTNTKKRLVAIIVMIVIAATTLFTVKFSLTASAYAEPGYMEIPQITVLTSGLGGNAGHWSNKNGLGGEFAQDDDSLVTKLSYNAGGAFIYRAHTANGDSNSPTYTFYEGYGTNEKDINSVSKHIIIVFDSENSDKSNAVVYNEFKNMLKYVVARVKSLNNGKNPKVNLIGHSRGGITNLQYALDYPQNVDSLISIGTPYFGSEPAKSFGKLIVGESDGLNDIVNETVYNEYYKRWSEGYESKYKNINSIAIGGATSVSYQREVLKNLENIGNFDQDTINYSKALATLLTCYEDALIQGIAVPILKQQYNNLSNKYKELKNFSEEQFVELITLINNDVHYGTWFSDVLVPVDSQQGVKGDKNYYFTKYVKEFSEDNSPLNQKLAVKNVPVIHNLETYDARIHYYIAKNIIMKSGDMIDSEISNVNKIENSSSTMLNLVWQIKVRNTHKETRTYAYNAKMCNFDDAKNWTGLKDIETFRLKPGETKIVDIASNGTATSIAVSSTNGDTRSIRYADNLWFQSDIRFDDNIYKMSVYVNNIPYHTYTQYGMKIGIACKKGSTWTVELTNKTGNGRTFEYNSKMCFEGDARNWDGLSHVTSVYLSNGETCLIKIQEYLFATSIAISYNIGIDKYIIYANNLAFPSGTMTSYANKTPTHYSFYGIDVAIVSKNSGTWELQLTNNTGSGRTFEYNYKMCFEGDAQNWKSLSHIKSVYLANGEKTKIQISEYGTATSIAISYMDGNYRKVFYANNLSSSDRTMTAMCNLIDTTQIDKCLAEGSLITLADGRQKTVESLTGNEMLLVWNMMTGSYDIAPLVFIDSEPLCTYDIINLHFSDDTSVKVIYEHGFWDFNLNEYVYLDENAEQYIGHWFNKQAEDINGDLSWEKVQLTDVTFTQEYTTAWSPVTYGHLCYYVNGMLSMPGGVSGLINIFDVDNETLTINQELFSADIENYGLFTYEEFYEIYPVPEEVFNAFNGQYLKISIGKGLITYENIGELIERYSEFFLIKLN